MDVVLTINDSKSIERMIIGLKPIQATNTTEAADKADQDMEGDDAAGF